MNLGLWFCSPSSFSRGPERRAMIRENLSKESRRPHFTWTFVSHVQLNLKQLSCPKVGGISDHVMTMERTEAVTERARAQEIPSLINMESGLEPNPVTLRGELIFQQRAVQQAFWWKGLCILKMQVWTQGHLRCFGFSGLCGRMRWFVPFQLCVSSLPHFWRKVGTFSLIMHRSYSDRQYHNSCWLGHWRMVPCGLEHDPWKQHGIVFCARHVHD